MIKKGSLPKEAGLAIPTAVILSFLEVQPYGRLFTFSGKIHYTNVFKMLTSIDPPLGFGKKCPERMAYKKLIRMNMPMDKEGKVSK